GDKPLMDPLGEDVIYNSFEKRSLASRFLSRLKRIGGRIKVGLSGSDTMESDLPDEHDADEFSSEDIIFPQMQKSASSKKKKKGSPLFKAIKWTVLLGIVFFVGHLTRPETIENTRETLKAWSALAVEKFEPLKEKVEEKVTEMVEKKSSGTATPGKKIKYWQAPMNPSYTSDKPGKSPMGMDLIPVYEEEKPQRKVKYWKAPMTAGFVSDKPGKSPMGMDLIPVYEDEEPQFGEGFRINPTVVQNIGVKTVKVKRRTLAKEIRTTGIVAYDERKVTHIHTKYKGWVEKLYVDFTGQEVNKDDLLAEVYSPELVSTQEELLVAMKYNQSLKDSPFTEIGKGAERLFESTKRRLELFDVPEHQIEELIREKKITKTLHIHSPFRGFVIKKGASEGMYVKPGMSLYTIADLSNIWVLADVYEYELPWIKIGQKVEMNLSYYPGKKFLGKVTYIDPFMDSKTRTLKVRMEFENLNWELKPDMYANVTLKSAIAKRSVAVPEEAVIHSGERQIVIVRDSSGGFDSRSLTLGAQADGYYQVLKGLKAGETVVTSSSFLLDSESRLKDALSKMQTKKKETSARPSGKNKIMDMSKMDEKGVQKKVPGIIQVHPDMSKEMNGNK
ncbi:MAG: efflux RND transporter periplasmic adaptor subunit, partial [Nitrospirota bacterium]|nr:efflux RND transporter periplasmic adaptor subunit [Nitrospirota bacterium]